MVSIKVSTTYDTDFLVNRVLIVDRYYGYRLQIVFNAHELALLENAFDDGGVSSQWLARTQSLLSFRQALPLCTCCPGCNSSLIFFFFSFLLRRDQIKFSNNAGLATNGTIRRAFKVCCCRAFNFARAGARGSFLISSSPFFSYSTHTLFLHAHARSNSLSHSLTLTLNLLCVLLLLNLLPPNCVFFLLHPLLH